MAERLGQQSQVSSCLLSLNPLPCCWRRLTNHGLEAAAEDASFEASDEAPASKALQRLRSEEATDRSSATKASGVLPCMQYKWGLWLLRDICIQGSALLSGASST